MTLNPGNLTLVVGSILLALVLAASTWWTARMLRDRELTYNPLLQPADVLVRVLLIVVCYLLGAASSLPPRVFGYVAANPVQEVLIGAGAGAGLAAAIVALSSLAVRVFGPGIYSTRILVAILPRTGLEWFLVPLVMAPAVLLEELLFRSLLVGGLGVWVNPWLVLVTTSLLFGLLHAPQGRLAVVMATAASVALGALFLWRNSLLAAVTAHYVVNVSQLLLAARLGDVAPQALAPGEGAGNAASVEADA